ncbi:MAG: hypothetical protein AABX88_02785 [Nanoarchaeota archaeon]
MAKKQKGIDFNEFFGSAISQGLEKIGELNPRWKGQEKFISEYFNQEGIKDLQKYALTELKKDPSKLEGIYQEIVSKVVDGEVFNVRGKEYILRSGLEEKASKPIRGFFARRELKKLGEIDKYIAFANETLPEVAKGMYGQMPEIAEGVTGLSGLNEKEMLLERGRKYELVREGDYQRHHRDITGKMREYAEMISEGFSKYMSPEVQTATASILGVLGTSFLTLFNPKVTGNVIGNVSSTSTNILGVVLILLALFLFLMRKKIQKKIIPKKKKKVRRKKSKKKSK